MSLIQAVLLGLVQGITEFLPISSSGHLVLAQQFLNLDTSNFFYLTILTHLATLLAVVIYFRKTLLNLIIGFFKRDPESVKLTFFLIIATLPVVIAALLFNDFVESNFTSPIAVLVCFLISGLFFIFAEYIQKKSLSSKNLGYFNTLIVGISQAIALFPGISRSGSTLATGIALGLSRPKAAEFSFLLSIPTIIGAAIFTLKDGVPDVVAGNPFVYLASFLTSFIAGYAVISGLMKLYQKHSLKGFAYYLLAVSIIGLFILFSQT